MWRAPPETTGLRFVASDRCGHLDGWRFELRPGGQHFRPERAAGELQRGHGDSGIGGDHDRAGTFQPGDRAYVGGAGRHFGRERGGDPDGTRGSAADAALAAADGWAAVSSCRRTRRAGRCREHETATRPVAVGLGGGSVVGGVDREGARGGAGGGRVEAERVAHPGRRHGVFGRGVLRRGDRDAEPGRAGEGGIAVHAVLQHRAVLAFAGGNFDGVLRAGGSARHGTGRAERGGRDAAGVGAAVAADAAGVGVPVVPLGEVARGRQAVGKRVRSLVQP